MGLKVVGDWKWVNIDTLVMFLVRDPYVASRFLLVAGFRLLIHIHLLSASRFGKIRLNVNVSNGYNSHNN